MDMVKKVADAMHDRVIGEISYATCEMLARVVIEAMREPTLEMIEAGQMENNLLENPDPPNAFLFLSRAEIKGAWEAMLEAALSPSGEK